MGLALLGITTCSAQTTSSTTAPTALTKNGTIQGRYLPEFEQDLFLGVPFAQAPRLDLPLPINKTYETPFDASEYGNTCYGFGSNPILGLTQSEDCLNLNVVRPTGTNSTSNLPVLFWMYGGGMSQGSTADPMWNLSYIISRSVEQGHPLVGVSINYRLSFFGFPGGQEIIDAGLSNLGLKDQRQALMWVQENIAAFGGDPGMVTLWGESAGSGSSVQQMVAYGGEGGTDLFHGAILVSGFASGTSFQTANSTQVGYDTLITSANCTFALDRIQCLREASLTTLYPLMDQITDTTWSSVIDGTFLRRPPAWEILDGNVAHIPILLGSNSDEGFIQIATAEYFPNNTNQTLYLLNKQFPLLNNTVITQLLDAYPEDGWAPPYSLPPSFDWCGAMNAVNLACGSQYRRAAALLGDRFSASARRYLAQLWASLGLPAYSFRFDTNPTSIPIQYFYGIGPGFATHGSELAYEFGLPAGFSNGLHFYPPVKDVAPHIEVSHEMNRRWISFAATGNPNNVLCKYPALPPSENIGISNILFSHPKENDTALQWPEYNLSTPQNFVFNATDDTLNLHIEDDDYREEAIQIWIDNVQYTDFDGVGP